MVIRLYETSDGEVLTQYVNKEKPVNVTKYVTAVTTKTVNAVKVELKPVKTVFITRIVPRTRIVTIKVIKPVVLTKILSALVSHVVVKGGKKEIRGGTGNGKVIRTQPKNAPVRAMV